MPNTVKKMPLPRFESSKSIRKYNPKWSSSRARRRYETRAAYCAAKHGVIGLTKVLAKELGPEGITANALCPGAVEGDRIEAVMRHEAAATGRTVDEVRALSARTVPEEGARVCLRCL